MKRLLNPLLALSLISATTLRADEPTTPYDTPPPQEETLPTPPAEEPPPPQEVGCAATDGACTGSCFNPCNIGIALLAAAVAVTAIILVSKNEGTHTTVHKDKHHD